MVRVDIFQGNREMDKEKVEVINTPETKLHFGSCFGLSSKVRLFAQL